MQIISFPAAPRRRQMHIIRKCGPGDRHFNTQQEVK
jgi:hypothetical protein